MGRGLLPAVASLVVEDGLEGAEASGAAAPAPERRLSSCGARAWLLWDTWDLPRSGV